MISYRNTGTAMALENWDTDAVAAWLSTLQLERYAPAFRKYRVDGRRLALGLSEKFMSAQLRWLVLW